MVTEEVTATEEPSEKLSGRSRRAETGWERQGDGKGTFCRREGETGGLGRVLQICVTRVISWMNVTKFWSRVNKNKSMPLYVV